MNSDLMRVNYNAFEEKRENLGIKFVQFSFSGNVHYR